MPGYGRSSKAAEDAVDLGVQGELLAAATAYQLDALVEVHDAREAETAVRCGAQLIGVNHRNLRTFEIDLGLTERLRKLIPEDVIVVAESGIHDTAAARRVYEAGANAILVGEVLMRAEDPAAKIKELTTWSE